MLGSVDFGNTAVVADFEAGIGTLTRMGDQPVDVVLVVVEPTPKSIEVGVRASALARDKTLGRVIIVASRIRNEDDLAVVTKAFPDDELVAVPADDAIVEADRDGHAPLDASPDAPAVRAIVALAESLVPSAR